MESSPRAIITSAESINSWRGLAGEIHHPAAIEGIIPHGSSFRMPWRAQKLQDHNQHCIAHCLKDSGTKMEDIGVSVTSVAGVTCFSTPWDLWSIPMESGFDYFEFPVAGNTEQRFVEIGTTIDYGALRRFVVSVIVKAAHAVEYRVERKSPRLSGKTLVSFRVDADGFHEESIVNSLDYLKLLNLPSDWFIDTKSWSQNLGMIRQIAKSELTDVHCHGYDHMTFRSQRINRLNQILSRSILMISGANPKGATAPLGFAPKGSLRRYQTSKWVKFASDFGLRINDAPFFLDNSFNSTLIVSTDNASVGAFEASGLSIDALVKHLRFRLNITATIGDPVVFYDHPSNGIGAYGYSILSTIKEAEQEQSVRCVSLSKLRLLWRQRGYGYLFANEVVEDYAGNTGDLFIPTSPNLLQIRQNRWQEYEERYNRNTFHWIASQIKLALRRYWS
ncbi:MAG: hypothetical protein WD492_05200 [Alkalispirochaeta sp.]